MKYFANVITISRILVSFFILLTIPFSHSFYVLYTYCGISDMVDGWIARKTCTSSQTGEILDSVADLIFVTVCFVKIFPVFNLPLWLIIWIMLIAVIKLSTLIRGFVDYHRLVFFHTSANKITGLSIFLLLFLYHSNILNIVAIIVAVIATFAALQEKYYFLKEKET